MAVDKAKNDPEEPEPYDLIYGRPDIAMSIRAGGAAAGPGKAHWI